MKKVAVVFTRPDGPEAVGAIDALGALGAEVTTFTFDRLMDLREKDFDAVVFADSTDRFEVLKPVALSIHAFHDSSKPIGAIGLASTLVARFLGKESVNVTIGDDESLAREIEKTGAQHVRCTVTDYVSDRDHKVLTTPSVDGVRKMMAELVEMA